MALPLHGIKVVDLGRLIAAPWASQMLADFGAEVIKVEDPRGGDSMRGTGPGFIRDAKGQSTTDSGKFSSTNRNKKSITVNLADPRGKEIVRTLAREADVLVENFKVGDLQRRGLDYESIRQLNPGIVYASITGFGQTGPYRHIGVIDPMIQAYSGFMSVNGELGGPPLKSNVNIMDFATGMYGAFAIMMALFERRGGAAGRHIDLAMLDCGVAMMSFTMLASLALGEQLPRLGSSNANWVPSGIFTCDDGPLYLAVGSDRDFANFCRVIGRDDLAIDSRYAQRDARNAHIAFLVGIASEALAKRPVADWVTAFNAVGLIAAPISDFAEIARNPQAQARGLVTQHVHGAGANIPMVRNPILMSGMDPLPMETPPLLGEHNAEILQGRLGLSAARIAQLAGAGVI